MPEEYKVEIGAQAKESEFDAIEQRIKRITDKEHPIKFKVDEKANGQLNSLKDALNNFANGIDLFKGIDINKQARRLGSDVNNSLKKSLNVDDVIGNAYKKLLKIENKSASPIRKNRLDSIAPILKDNIGLLENFNNAMNNTTNLSDWNNVLGVVQSIQDG